MAGVKAEWNEVKGCEKWVGEEDDEEYGFGLESRSRPEKKASKPFARELAFDGWCLMEVCEDEGE